MKKFFVLLICTLLLVPALAGCGWGYNIGFGTIDGPGELFEVNDAGEFDLDGVDKISVITISDNAILQSGGTKIAASLKGQCRSTTKPVRLDARKDGNTVILEVKYPKSISYSDTELIVVIPDNYKGALSVGTVSGNIEAEGFPNELTDVSLNSVSGAINFNTASLESLKATTISGGISVKGITGRATAKTVSGEINLDYVIFAATDATTVSGSVTASIPAGTSFSVDYGTVSGSFSSDHPSLHVSSADHGFNGSTAEGGETIKVNTTSGSFRIESK